MVSMSDTKQAIFDEYEKLKAKFDGTEDAPEGDDRYAQIGRLTVEWLEVKRSAEVSADDWRADAIFKEIEALVDR